MFTLELTSEQLFEFKSNLTKLKGTTQHVLENYSSGKFTLEGHDMKVLMVYKKEDKELEVTLQEHPFWIPEKEAEKIIKHVFKTLLEGENIDI